MKALWTPMLTLALGAIAIGACGDDAGTNKADTTTGSDVTFNGDVDDTSQPDTVAAVRLLDFDQPFGDDQKPCQGQPRCAIYVGFADTRTLKVKYTEDGEPVSGRNVKIAKENDAENVGFVSTQTAVTDASGIAQFTTKATAPARVGQFAIKVFVEGEGAPPAKYFDVVISPKGQVPLTVIATYAGTRPVATFNARLYKQNAQGSPNCSNMVDLMENQTSTQSRDGVQLVQSAKFPEFDGLEQDGKQKYTLLVFSPNSNNAVQAWGCDATVEVEWGKSKTAEVPMLDRAPLYAGTYTVTSKFDFISAIPEPYGTYVDYVVSFFQDPTGTVLELACDLLTDDGETLNSFCDLVFDQDGSGNLQLTALGGFVSDLLNAVIEGLAQGSVFGTIFQVGGDVADILKQFEMQASFVFKKEPTAQQDILVFADGDATEDWKQIKVKWTLGANCDPETEQGCGVRTFNTSAFQTSAITGSFKASVANFYDLTIDMHSLNLKYGALINYFLEAFLIPLVVKNEAVNTYEDLLSYLVGGGYECIAEEPGSCPTSQNDNNCCCKKFADSDTIGDNSGSINGGVESAVVAACDVIVKTAPTFLRGTLQGLDLDSGDTFNIGTKTPCKLADNNDDLIIDDIGKQSTPCQWNVQLKFGSGDPVFIDAKFFGKRAEQ